ncbi:hypothetical protein D3C76_1811920 [compost metagenome]
MRLQTLIKRITQSELAKVNASIVFGTKYCNTAPPIMKIHEKIKPFEGTARFDKRPNALGA